MTTGVTPLENKLREQTFFFDQLPEGFLLYRAHVSLSPPHPTCNLIEQTVC